MKKPTYMELRFPRGKSTIALAVKRYFKHLEGKVLKIDFGKKRSKKIFEYRIISAQLRESWSWPSRKEEKFFQVEVELIIPGD